MSRAHMFLLIVSEAFLFSLSLRALMLVPDSVSRRSRLQLNAVEPLPHLPQARRPPLRR
jgi:hypothetical protein